MYCNGCEHIFWNTYTDYGTVYRCGHKSIEMSEKNYIGHYHLEIFKPKWCPLENKIKTKFEYIYEN